MKYKVGQYKKFAQDDLEQLEINKANDFSPYRSSCVHAQQYTEKMLKEKLVELEHDPRFEHNLVVILNELESLGIVVSEETYMRASILSNYYMAARYPGYKDFNFGEETAEEAYECALAIVESICNQQPDA